MPLIKDQEAKHYEMRKKGGIVQGYVQQLVNMLLGWSWMTQMMHLKMPLRYTIDYNIKIYLDIILGSVCRSSFNIAVWARLQGFWDFLQSDSHPA